MTMRYSGTDERVEAVAFAVARRFAYDENQHTLGEYGASAADVKAEHIWLMPDLEEDGYEPLAIAGPTTLTYVHGDHLGAPALLTDASGAIANRYDALPFGQRWASLAASPTTALAFPGQLIDAVDRHYNLHRDYDPTLGRYLQADPIGLAGGANPYAYAEGNPLSLIDPDGRIPLLAIVPAVWAGFELFSSAYDVYDAYRTARDPCSTTRDKAISIAGAAIGIFAPGGGYGVAAKTAPSLDDLSRAAAAAKKGGFTEAGGSLQKHGSRPGSKWNQTGIDVNKPRAANPRGQNLVDDALTTPGSKVVPNPRGGWDVVAPDGRTIRYNRDGSFQGFRE